jgi:hypothetical protein
MGNTDQIYIDATSLDDWIKLADQVGQGNDLAIDLQELLDDPSVHRLRPVLDAIDSVRGLISLSHDQGLDGLHREIESAINAVTGNPDDVG